jgi:hypothetical protein
VSTTPSIEKTESRDSVAPLITDISVQATGKASAAIIWTTDEPATSQVEYGLTPSYGSITAPDTELVIRHTVILSGLSAGNKYNFRVRSEDAGGNESASQNFTLVTSLSSTIIGGTISENTTWTVWDSPYLITSTVQIPAGVILTIEPGVSALMSGDDDYAFTVRGTVIAHGIPGKRIILDGGMHSFFNSENAGLNATVDLDYCTIKNGARLINFARCFSLRHSEVTNLTEYSDISFGPTRDVYIEYNKFTDASGFSTGGGAQVYIRYNYFNTKNQAAQDIPWIMNKASPATIVSNNFFINTDGLALMLQGGQGSEGMVATANYWGTQNIAIIDAMIYDKKDDSNLASYIEYLPIRTSPEPVRLFSF